MVIAEVKGVTFFWTTV